MASQSKQVSEVGFWVEISDLQRPSPRGDPGRTPTSVLSSEYQLIHVETVDINASQALEANPSTITFSSLNSTSSLPAYIQSIPWQEGFTIGHGNGVDALTGSLAKSAVKPFHINPSMVKRSMESFKLLGSESDLAEEIAANASVALNIGKVGISFGGSSVLTSKAKVSATSFSILGTYTAVYEPFDLASSYELTAEAVKFAKTSPGEFRGRYGDYFVAGGQRSSSFTALLVVSSTNVRSLGAFSAKLGAKLHELFTAEGSVEWANIANETGVHIEVEVEMLGYLPKDDRIPSAPWDTEEIGAALSWFKKHEMGVYRSARLHHYSTLSFDIPRSVDVQSDVFAEVRNLHSLLSTIAVLAGSCPENESRSKLRFEVMAISQDVDARQAELAQVRSTLRGFLKRAEELRERLQTLHRRYRFFVNVQARISTQPTHRIVASKNLRHWTYGYLSYMLDSTIKIESTSQRLTARPTFTLFKREGTLTYSTPMSDRLIVGWEVVSHRVDGHNGSWRKLSQNVLLDTSGSITFRSKGYRNVDWELITYHVDSALFSFPTSERPSAFSTPSYNVSPPATPGQQFRRFSPPSGTYAVSGLSPNQFSTPSPRVTGETRS